MSGYKRRYAPEIKDTSGWFKNESTGKIHCGLCLPAFVALVHQAEPMMRFLTTKLGDYSVLQEFQVLKLTPEEIAEHQACAE